MAIDKSSFDTTPEVLTEEWQWDTCEHEESLCNDHRMSEHWEQGFCCDLPKHHDGPHRDTFNARSAQPEKDWWGRPVRDTYEWQYVDTDKE